MRIFTLLGLALLAPGIALAEPEIKGTAPELAQFISGVAKTVAVTGEAEARVPAHRAVLSLRVVTENKSLQEALRANLDLRSKVADHMTKHGIPADRIQASKFSSTPKFGMFGDKAKSYRVENLMRVAVQDEKQFQGAAGAVDTWQEVQYGGVEFEYADKEEVKAKVIERACDNAAERKKLYEAKFGMTLVPSRFNEGVVVQKNAENLNAGNAKRNYRGSLASDSEFVTAVAEESDSSFGELVYTARVTVEYTVQPK
jgi:uncharacterized protein YggE